MKVSGMSDDFGRTTKILTSCGEGKSVFLSEYEYKNGKSANSTTNFVGKLTQSYGSNQVLKYEYSYNRNGNITEIKQNDTVVAKYNYDELNQLTYAMDRNSGLFVNYNYDNAGNITSVKEYGLSTTSWSPLSLKSEKTYTYGDTNWKDKMTKYNGTTITYDKMGNPLSYRDGMKMTWQNGRQLASLQTGDSTATYKYDSNGMRTQKTDNSGTTYYYYDSNNNLIGLTKGDDTLLFYYDSDSNVTSFKYGDTMYYYIKNLQGDIVKIINQSGTVYATYVYDAWGNIKSVSGAPGLRELNPFRYRSYLYDSESGLYYLQSRYYDPFTGRFLNADDTEYIDFTGTVLGTNIFAYCENNPIVCTDYKGTYSTTTIKTKSNLRKFNCYAYAMGFKDRWLHPGKGRLNVLNGNYNLKSIKYQMPYYYTVFQVRDWVVNDFGIRMIRKINSRTSKIYSGEYKVAIKIKVQGKHTIDFHFVKQDPKTKYWYDKPGSTNIRRLNGFNPDSTWKGGYNSVTLYVAVRAKFFIS